ncbi:hypothetical protein BZG36_01803 [Bifiguratus adelaidae]|uniref:EF-hand domain-containing protein n=1 Tax=Bifiguratus adelaidae TaxID=1938954 RepID=A0A261Y2D4_9FUNG|nr:hypothetical protein BZG36_01803 [Bifiguratus adelaidae]
MGQTKSKETADLARHTHFTSREIDNIRDDFRNATAKHIDKPDLSEQEFKEACMKASERATMLCTVKKYVPSIAPEDNPFLERLYAAFDVDNNHAVDFNEFVDGLSVFMKGTSDEKLELSFKLYDLDHDGFISRPDLLEVLTKLSEASADSDQTLEIQDLVNRMFEDLDVDGDGKLDLHEYKLSAMKEPLIVDFLEQFLAEHQLSRQPSPPSRPESRGVSSYASYGSLVLPSNTTASPNPNSPNNSPVLNSHQRLRSQSSSLSLKLSQLDLIEAARSHKNAQLDPSQVSPNGTHTLATFGLQTNIPTKPRIHSSPSSGQRSPVSGGSYRPKRQSTTSTEKRASGPSSPKSNSYRDSQESSPSPVLGKFDLPDRSKSHSPGMMQTSTERKIEDA